MVYYNSIMLGKINIYILLLRAYVVRDLTWFKILRDLSARFCRARFCYCALLSARFCLRAFVLRAFVTAPISGYYTASYSNARPVPPTLSEESCTHQMAGHDPKHNCS